jgi:hypothetical protein
MIAILSGILAIVFAAIRAFLIWCEQKDISRLKDTDITLEEKEGIMRRMPTYEKSKRMALMMAVILIFISITFIVMNYMNPPSQ